MRVRSINNDRGKDNIKKNCLRAVTSNNTPTYSGLEQNPGFHGEWPQATCLNYGMAWRKSGPPYSHKSRDLVLKVYIHKKEVFVLKFIKHHPIKI